MNVSSSPEPAAAPVLNEEITKAADLHKGTVMGLFGKVSAVTGWRAFFRGEFFGSGVKTIFTGSSLLASIKLTHGQTIANKVDQQLGLSATSDTPINSYKVAKAVAMVEELSFLHNVKMLVGNEEKSLDPNDPFYLQEKAGVDFKIFDQLSPSKDAKKSAVAVYPSKKAFKDAYNTALSEELRQKDWSVITTTMPLDPLNPSKQTITTTITPAGQTDALKKSYANAEIRGIPSSETSSKHAVGLRINKSDQFSIVSSGLDVPLNVEENAVANIIQSRFEERLLVNLETQGKLPKAALAATEPGSSENNPITILMTDFGMLTPELVTEDNRKEGEPQDKQF
ncbi:MAG: hypothetical protein WCO92_02125, partial [Verrucomicrobiota bacterium]